MAKQNRLAVKGLHGWHVKGTDGPNCTFSVGPYENPPGDCIAIDMSRVYEQADNALGMVWNRPSLNLNLPDGNVRNLFEGCIGYEGTTEGHPWDGKLESLSSTDAVGLDVFVALLKTQGGEVV